MFAAYYCIMAINGLICNQARWGVSTGIVIDNIYSPNPVYIDLMRWLYITNATYLIAFYLGYWTFVSRYWSVA